MRFRNRTTSGLTLAAILILALSVAACGRKGGLDPPPSASAAGDAGDAGEPGDQRVVSPGGATVGPNKSLPIDVLVN